MIPTIQELRTPSAARVEAEQRLAEAQAQCDAAAKKLETAKADCLQDPSLANFKTRAKAERELEPYVDFLAERQKEAKAALAAEQESKRARIPGIHEGRLRTLQVDVLERVAVIEELNKAVAKGLAELEKLANEFDRETAELAKFAREIGTGLPDDGVRFYWGAVVPRPSNAHDVVQALLPETDTVLGLPLAGLAVGDGPHCVIHAKNIAGIVASRRASLKRLKASLPVVDSHAQAAGFHFATGTTVVSDGRGFARSDGTGGGVFGRTPK